MKNRLILALAALFICVSFIIISCNKNDATKMNHASTSNIDKSGKIISTTTATQISILTVQLHRLNGYRKVQPSQQCDCAYRFGLCDLEILGIDIVSGTWSSQNFNLGIEESGTDNIARLYFFENPDDDVTVVPIFYVDHDVLVHKSDNSNIIIKQGEYDYIATPGTYTFPDGSSKDYIGYADVNL